MNKATRLKLAVVRAEFESWVNDRFMLDESESPASWHTCSKRELDKWELAPYDHPWTAGAWEAWKKLNGLPNNPGSDD